MDTDLNKLLQETKEKLSDAAEKAADKIQEFSENPTVKDATAKGEVLFNKTADKVKEKAKKTAKAVKEKLPTERAVLQYGNVEIDVGKVMERAKEDWKMLHGGPNTYVRKITIYLKPEEGRAYYVVNEEDTGFVTL
ncbi:MAG: DUF6465 family protein [Eubacterium sp.]|nr:DUF6465 family protein [Eubacterium sp.]